MRQFVSWTQFKSGLMLRFGNLKIRGPSQSLFCIKQTDTIADFVHHFEDLSSQVSGLDDQQLEGIFLNGLTPEMQELVLMQKPNDLPEMVAIALSMETSIMRRVVRKELQLANAESKEGYGHEYKGSGATNSNTWKMKAIVSDTHQGVKQTPRFEQRPKRHHSSAELDEKRRKGICFRCDGQLSREHKCPNKELRVLTVINGFEVEVLEDSIEEEREEPVGQLMELSFSSFMGILSPTTTKLRGAIGKKDIVIMLDNGATHNFISPDAVKKLKLRSKDDSNLNVRLGTGIAGKGIGVCSNVSFSVQGLNCTTDFITLDLGQVDVILGIYWLRTLGKCKVNWGTHEYSFQYEGKTVTLRGEPELHSGTLSLKLLSTNVSVKKKGVEVELYNHQVVKHDVNPLPVQITEVLTKYNQVFGEPRELPPLRGSEHAINLIPGSGPISVRPLSISTCS
ncbi:hypothetical protein V5N11_009041 [Cardamine amara subsp. amara]|uniref:Retrotransposon gag domain-containing protein n=1 Tax=Cardamine amara subsp. amara TaxID=228776 RepID=A0ABD1C7C1_CARAN